MFRHLRIQLIHPCRARCKWCATHRKNETFQALVDSGVAERFHDFYLQVIEAYPPSQLYVSGGEPLLSPGLPHFLRQAGAFAECMHVFTSYQYANGVMQRIAESELPHEQIVLNHTPIYFEPERWLELTGGFPFETYLQNIRSAMQLPVRKRFKFIINHDLFYDEIARFIELVEPDQKCEISLKLLNDQGDGLGVVAMQRTAERVQQRLDELGTLLGKAGWQFLRPEGSLDHTKKVITDGTVEACPYRSQPLELRLSFFRSQGEKHVLKYRYCPYFPPDFGHRFHLGKDELRKLGKNFKKGPFRDHCQRCRLLHYHNAETVYAADDIDEPLAAIS